jgi:hypothetical protein
MLEELTKQVNLTGLTIAVLTEMLFRLAGKDNFKKFVDDAENHFGQKYDDAEEEALFNEVFNIMRAAHKELSATYHPTKEDLDKEYLNATK